MAANTLLLHDRERHRLAMAGVRLTVRGGPDRGRELLLDREEVVVGTAAGCDLRLTDPTVSRHHLSLRVRADHYEVSDLESTNGTRIGKQRVRVADVEPGEIIELGRTRLRLERADGEVSLALSARSSFGALVGDSAAARRLFALLEAVALADATVLLMGETGAGKDLAATAIHEASRRRNGPFIIVDCGALQPTLVESELFGHEKGAFTGAGARRIGAFEEADGGTLFLDEIGEFTREMQVSLLGALERRVIRRVGGSDSVAVDVRVIAATNRDLRIEVNRGAFREDLYHRLNVLTVRIPPLRERSEDIPLLAERFWRERSGDPHAELPPHVVEELMAHLWPGNVRELRNRIEQLAALPDLGADTTEATRSYRDAKTAAVDAFERRFVAALLERARGNVSEAARLAAMDRPHLIKLIRKHGLGTRR